MNAVHTSCAVKWVPHVHLTHTNGQPKSLLIVFEQNIVYCFPEECKHTNNSSYLPSIMCICSTHRPEEGPNWAKTLYMCAIWLLSNVDWAILPYYKLILRSVTQALKHSVHNWKVDEQPLLETNWDCIRLTYSLLFVSDKLINIALTVHLSVLLLSVLLFGERK